MSVHKAEKIGKFLLPKYSFSLLEGCEEIDFDKFCLFVIEGI